MLDEKNVWGRKPSEDIARQKAEDEKKRIFGLTLALHEGNLSLIKKLEETFGLWRIRAVGNDYVIAVSKEWVEKNSYKCENGVRLLNEDFTRPYEDDLVALLSGIELDNMSELICPSCGQDDVVKMGILTSKKFGKRQRWKCQNCGQTFYID